MLRWHSANVNALLGRCYVAESVSILQSGGKPSRKLVCIGNQISLFLQARGLRLGKTRIRIQRQSVLNRVTGFARISLFLKSLG